MMRSLWVKFLVLLCLISLISLSAALFFRGLVIKDFHEYLEGDKEDKIYRVMAAVEGSYEKNSGWNDDALKRNTIWALLTGYEVKIVDNSGNLLMDTRKAMETMPPLMKKRIAALTGFSVEELQSGSENFIGYPMFLGGKEIGVLEVRLIAPKGAEGRESVFMRRSNSFLVLTIFVLGGLSLVTSLVFSKKLTDPIKKLTAAANDISEGNIKSRVSVSGNDEISTLARTFNNMADNIEMQESLRRKLTSNIAHELRTPISAMQGEIEGMLDGLIEVDKDRLSSLHEETQRLKKIIEGIEELSRAQASILEMNKQTLTIKPFLNNIKDRFERLFIDKGVKLRLECDDTLTLHADPDKLSQIVINLLGNALKATDKGGSVLIKAGIKGDDGFVEVTDTGSGIKKEDISFVFERFYKASEGGLGLGLAIAKELAVAHGGRIEVRSELGKGATFTLYIPTFTISS